MPFNFHMWAVTAFSMMAGLVCAVAQTQCQWLLQTKQHTERAQVAEVQVKQDLQSESSVKLSTLRVVDMADRNKNVYFAKLAEQAERYDEMVEFMKKVVESSDELSVEERNLLSLAYQNAVGSRRAAWRIITNREQQEKSQGNVEKVKYAKEYREKVVEELQRICDSILGLLGTNLIAKASTAESRVFYQKMKADYYRYMAEFSAGNAKSEAAENAHRAYGDALLVAAKDLAVTDPVRLGLALTYSVFMYEVLRNPDEARKIAKDAFEDAIGELDNVPEGSQSRRIMQFLRDNLTWWTSEAEGAEGDEQMD